VQVSVKRDGKVYSFMVYVDVKLDIDAERF
jgi:hypothetical protein